MARKSSDEGVKKEAFEVPPLEELIRDPELTQKTLQQMEDEDVFQLYRQMIPMFSNGRKTETLVYGEFHYWVWEYGEGFGERAERFEEFMRGVPSRIIVDNIALHLETWKDEICPKLHGDGSRESFKKSMVGKSLSNQEELEK